MDSVIPAHDSGPERGRGREEPPRRGWPPAAGGTHPKVERIARLCADVGALPEMAGAATQGRLDDLARSMAEPFRLAVVGRVKAGKSTLVNALVGRQIAPTAAGECTRVVTWYRYGTPDRAVAVLGDDSRAPVGLVDRALPEDLGIPVEQVQRVEVHLQARALRSLTLIDTPGLATLTEHNEAATRAAILGEHGSARSRHATGDADALLYVVRESERDDDVAFLRDFRSATGNLSASAVNTLGVLSQADLFSTEDPVGTAARTAERIALSCAADLGTVVAVSGLLGEAARTGRITEDLAADLAALAGVPDALLPAWESVEVPGLDRRRAERCARALGPFGLLRGRSHATAGASALRRWSEEVSGIIELEEALADHMLPRAHLIKAGRALGALSALARDQSSEAARDLIEEAALDPLLHSMTELRALHDLLRSNPEAPQRAQLEALLAGGAAHDLLGLPEAAPDATVQVAARRASAQAREAASLAMDLEVVRASNVLARSYALLAETGQQ